MVTYLKNAFGAISGDGTNQLRRFKRGDTFSVLATINDELGKPVTGIAAELKAQIRNRQDELVDECVIAETTTAGTYSLVVADTTEWPVDSTLFMDIQRTSAGVISSTETIAIPVERDVTR